MINQEFNYAKYEKIGGKKYEKANDAKYEKVKIKIFKIVEIASKNGNPELTINPKFYADSVKYELGTNHDRLVEDLLQHSKIYSVEVKKLSELFECNCHSQCKTLNKSLSILPNPKCDERCETTILIHKIGKCKSGYADCPQRLACAKYDTNTKAKLFKIHIIQEGMNRDANSLYIDSRSSLLKFSDSNF